MDKNTEKIIIFISIFLVFGGLTALLALKDLNLGFAEFLSVNGVIEKRAELVVLEEKLSGTETTYNSSKKKLNVSKSNFETAKAKYETISNETVNLIKEATTEENYDIEYMWIKLGNYALSNNLSIVMIEPGGKVVKTEQVENTEDKTTEQKVKDEVSKKTSTGQTMNAVNETLSEADLTNKNPNSTSSVTTTTNTDDTLLTVTIEGSYLNMSDFIFEVENDKELRFKLDNIEITYVAGTTIKAKFNVKNVIVLK